MTTWIDAFPGLSRLDAQARRRLAEVGEVIQKPQGSVIFGPGAAPQNMLLLVEGAIRVQQTSENGREIVLYRVYGGESCVLTTACLLAYEDYAAQGVAETDLRAVAIPRGVFDELMAGSAPFRRFVFMAYAKRITGLFGMIDEVAFKRIDLRLARTLLSLAGESGALKATHQQLAHELGTAREVVSRQLQEFQRREWLEAGRGEIRLLDKDALARYAAGEHVT